ncbi:hypothetical protein [Cupriavidus basilensis]|uniref:Uncharacterized protein n=1 Tax=Cupriavidus basilensis TaxID=68895 RepID=A0A0C4Y1A4_9BURK|nr:hypothetical protein [Cupriavidus basilensis]AJG18812.1 hypothetical protein RR42_m1410 [Cupriavidus basilensis]
MNEEMKPGAQALTVARWTGSVSQHANGGFVAVSDYMALASEHDSWKRMYEDAVRSLACIDQALGIPADEAGGAAPILAEIERLKEGAKVAGVDAKHEALELTARSIAHGNANEWAAQDGKVGSLIESEFYPFIETDVAAYTGDDADDERLRAYLAAANPNTVLELFDCVRAVRASAQATVARPLMDAKYGNEGYHPFAVASMPKLGLTDDFAGDNVHLVRCIEALISLDANGSLVPHGIGCHARTLLSASAVRLARQERA